MGHKTHPYGFRLGIIKDWKAHWYAPNGSAYRSLVKEDLDLRDCVRNEYRAFSDAGIARVEIDRGRRTALSTYTPPAPEYSSGATARGLRTCGQSSSPSPAAVSSSISWKLSNRS